MIPLNEAIDWNGKGALCIGITSMFYPDQPQSSIKKLPPSVWVKPREVCNRCPLKIECRDYARNRGERYGMWGGENDVERLAFRRNRRKMLVNQ